MVNPDFRKFLKDKRSRYSLVIAVAKRARDISEDKDMSEKIGTEKPVSHALDEIMNGEIEIVEPEETENE